MAAGRTLTGVAGIAVGGCLSLVLLPPALAIAAAFLPVNLLLSFYWAVTTPRFGWRVCVIMFPFAWLAAVALCLLELLGFPLAFPALSLVQPVVGAGATEAACLAGTVVQIGVGMVKSIWRNHVGLAAYILRPQKHGRRVDVASVAELPAVLAVSLGCGVGSMLAAAMLALAKAPGCFFSAARYFVRKAKRGGRYSPALLLLLTPVGVVSGVCGLAAALVAVGPMAVAACGYGVVAPFRSLWFYRVWTNAGLLVGNWLHAVDCETSRAMGLPRLLPHTARCIPPPRNETPWEPQITEVSSEFYGHRERARKQGLVLNASRTFVDGDEDGPGLWQFTVDIFRLTVNDALAEGLLTRGVLTRFPPEGALNPSNAVVNAVLALTLFETAHKSTLAAGDEMCVAHLSLMSPVQPQSTQLTRQFARRYSTQGRSAMTDFAFHEIEKATESIEQLGALSHEERVWMRWWLAGWDECGLDWYYDCPGGEERLRKRLLRRGLEPPSAGRLQQLMQAASHMRKQAHRAAALLASRRVWSDRRARDDVRSLWNIEVPAVCNDLSSSEPTVLLAQSPCESIVQAPDFDLDDVVVDGAPATVTVHGSYHPAHPARPCQARVLIDGEEFFAAAAHIINEAKHEVMISSWKLSPWVGMGRCADKDVWSEWKRAEQTGEGSVGAETVLPQGEMLLDLLIRKATEGVRIHVLIFQNHPDIMATHFTDEAVEVLAEANASLPVGCGGCISCLRHPHSAACARDGLHGEAIKDRGTAASYALSHHQKFIVSDRRLAIIGGFDLCIGRWDSTAHLLSDPQRKVWPGQDYYCPAVGVASFLPKCQKEWLGHQYIDSTLEVRLPWHDTALYIDGAPAADAASCFIDRWNHHREEPTRDVVPDLPRALDEQIRLTPVSRPDSEQQKPTHQVQVLRSFAPWCGGGCVEMSVYGGYVAAIRSARHMVYMENQYFSSSCGGVPPDDDPENLVFAALLARLVQAKRENKQHFRVVLVVTLPEETDESAQGLIKWLLRALYRGEHSLTQKLRLEHGWSEEDIQRHISVTMLRSHAILPRRDCAREEDDGEHPDPWLSPEKAAERERQLRAGPVAVGAMVFCHSKLLIVDDRVLIVGSANLNDRSLLGRRDSELCAMMVDRVAIKQSIGGDPRLVGRSINEARMKLWGEHLGVSGSAMQDLEVACSDKAMQLWRSTADGNAQIYNMVFPNEVPCDAVKLLSEYNPMPFRPAGDVVAIGPAAAAALKRTGAWPRCPPSCTVRELLSHVRGHVYTFPSAFLSDDELSPLTLATLSGLNGFSVMQ